MDRRRRVRSVPSKLHCTRNENEKWSHERTFNIRLILLLRACCCCWCLLCSSRPARPSSMHTTWPLTQHYTVYPYDNIMCSNRILWSSTLHTAMMMAMHFIRLFFLFLLPHNQTQSLANDESQWDYHHHHQRPSFRGISTVVNHQNTGL